MGIDIQLRPYRTDDAQDVHRAVQESVMQLQPWMPWAQPAYSLEDCRTWLTAQVAAFENRSAYEFAIVSAAGDYLARAA